MTEINKSDNSRPVAPLHQALKASNAPSNQAIAPTSDATAHGEPVNILAKKASVFNDCEIPEETLNRLRSANENPNLKGIQNLLDAAGLVCDDIAQIAAKSALGFQAV